MAEEGTPLHPHDKEAPLVLDELRHQLDQFRILRTGGDDAATIALLDKLGAHDPVETQLVLELSATRVLGHPERFTEAHALAMHALEVLDRNGARSPNLPRLGPLDPIANWGVQLVIRFIVRNHQADVIDAVRNLYVRRLAWCPPDDVARLPLVRARLDAERVSNTYKGNPIGVPAFLLGGAVISGVAQGARLLIDTAIGSRFAAILAIIGTFAVLASASWCILRGAAIARHRIAITVKNPLNALWETIGRCGHPPEDDGQTFAVYAILLTILGWFLIPVGILFVVAAF